MKKELPKRKRPRLKNFDYSQAGAYFVTICTHNRRCILSQVVGRGLAPAEIRLSEYGEIADEQICSLEKRYPSVRVDAYVIMPNHIHMLIVIGENASETSPQTTNMEDAAGASPRPTLMDIVGAYKSLTTRACKKKDPIDKLFQDSFYEHIIRDMHDYEDKADYICANPTKWEEDELFGCGK